MENTEVLADRRLVVIGCGEMGSALVAGWVDDGLVEPGRIYCADRHAEKNAQLARRHGVERIPVEQTPGEVVEPGAGRIFVVAVEPDDLGAALEPNAPHLTATDEVVSVAAGVDTSRIRELVGDDVGVVRAMPNAPAEVGAGVSGLYADGDSDRALAAAEALFGAVGETVTLQKERHFHPVTALGGSGPAFAFAILEALADGAVAEGLSREDAVLLARETLRGAAELAGSRDDLHTAELKDRVTSPGGTTAEGLTALESGGVRSALIRAVREAASKSRELGAD